MNSSDGNLSATADGVFIDSTLGIQKIAASPSHLDDATGTQDLNYSPTPPRKTILLSVEYHVRGRGRPMPYELSEDFDE